MARIRTIKPEFWTDEKLAECSTTARLLFIGTWNFADDEGRLEYSPKRLKMQIFPGDIIDVAALVHELVETGLVTVYRIGGRDYLQIPGFKKHQRIDHPRPSIIPAPAQEHSEKGRRAITESSPSAPSPLPDASENNPLGVAPDGTGVDGIEKEESKATAPGSGAILALRTPETATLQLNPTDVQIDQLYKLYPRKIAPMDAKKAIRRAVSQVMRGDADHPAMCLAAALDFLQQRLRLFSQCTLGRDRQFIPHPATWFHDARFWDDPAEWHVEESNNRKKSNGGFHHDGDDSAYTKGADHVFDNQNSD